MTIINTQSKNKTLSLLIQNIKNGHSSDHNNQTLKKSRSFVARQLMPKPIHSLTTKGNSMWAGNSCGKCGIKF